MTERIVTRIMVTVSLLISLGVVSPGLVYASIVYPEWQIDISENEPELAAIRTAGLRATPVMYGHEEFPRMVLIKVREDALKRQWEINAHNTDLIRSKLMAAYTAQPPQWDLVWLCLFTAYYAPPDEKICQIALKIMETPPPPPPFGGDTLLAASHLLIATKDKQYIQVVYDYLAQGDFVNKYKDKMNVTDVGIKLVYYFSELPLADAKIYLVKLSSQYPYSEELKKVMHQTPVQIITCMIDYHLRFVDDALNGRTMEKILDR